MSTREIFLRSVTMLHGFRVASIRVKTVHVIYAVMTLLAIKGIGTVVSVMLR